jgi:hypothetical protein
VTRRVVLRLGAVGAAGAAVTAAGGLAAPYLAQKGLLSADGAFAATATALGDLLFYQEVYPTSPLLILSPFTDALPIPKALAPVPASTVRSWPLPPGPGPGQQNSLRNEQHQIWPNHISREDTIGLDPGESVIIYRGFRDFVGPYVVHCHNLMHEDHAMMFAWEIVP